MLSDKKIVINPDYVCYTDFINRLPDIFHTEGETIYKSRNEIKVFEVNGVKINVKQYKTPFGSIVSFILSFARQKPGGHILMHLNCLLKKLIRLLPSPV